MDLRPAHQPALHAEDEPAAPRPTSTTSSPATSPANRHERDRSRERLPARFTYDELVARDKASLDIFWLRDESLEDTDNLPAPDVIAAEIVEDLKPRWSSLRKLPLTLRL